MIAIGAYNELSINPVDSRKTERTLSAPRAVVPPLRFRGTGTSIRCRMIVVWFVMTQILASPVFRTTKPVSDSRVEGIELDSAHLLHKRLHQHPLLFQVPSSPLFSPSLLNPNSRFL